MFNLKIQNSQQQKTPLLLQPLQIFQQIDGVQPGVVATGSPAIFFSNFESEEMHSLPILKFQVPNSLKDPYIESQQSDGWKLSHLFFFQFWSPRRCLFTDSRHLSAFRYIPIHYPMLQDIDGCFPARGRRHFQSEEICSHCRHLSAFMPLFSILAQRMGSIFSTSESRKML